MGTSYRMGYKILIKVILAQLSKTYVLDFAECWQNVTGLVQID